MLVHFHPLNRSGLLVLSVPLTFNRETVSHDEYSERDRQGGSLGWLVQDHGFNRDQVVVVPGAAGRHLAASRSTRTRREYAFRSVLSWQHVVLAGLFVMPGAVGY
jgi:hypothetical protein